ncbi:hypothetical protein ACIQ1D_19460 [Lysinibacillus xylanilyticus]|uniref:hypothetical protein n=1 Tax=Lysinibacillus xylanilyticus TaxID=582475 RepID=UPI003814A265
MATKRKVEKKICSNPECQKELALTNFYNTTDIHFFPDGKIPICKNCCYAMFDNDGFHGFQTLMRLINKPIYADIFKGDYRDYIRIINSMPQYRDKTFADSTLFDDVRSNESKAKEKLTELSKEDFKELEIFFGEGYNEKDYIYLSYEYDDYCNRYEVDSKALENLIKEIVITQLDIRKKRAVGDKVDAQQKTLQDLLGSSNLKPVQETGANAVDQESFGTLIKKWENERPIPEPDEAWKDVDGIGKYVRTFFLGHLARLFGKEGDNPYKDEYEVEIEKHTVRPPNRNSQEEDD